MADYFIIYEDKNFSGRNYRVNLSNTRAQILYTLKSTRVHDKMSSIRWQLSSGKEVTFYEHNNGTGRRYTIRGSGSDRDTHNNNFKDCASSWRLRQGNSVPRAFSKISTRGQTLKFERNGISMPSGGHMQGIQQLDSQHLVISGSASRKAFFFIVKWTGGIRASAIGKVIKLVRINDNFPNMKHNHASGIQLINSVLVVGTEGGNDPIKSSVVFYDLSNVNAPRVVGNRINRSWDTAGAVAIVKRSRDHLLAVGGWDSDRIDFYRSNYAALTSPLCVFTRFKTWQQNQKDTRGWIDGNWGAYQGLNLVRESNGKLFLLGFNRNAGGHDWADLYSVHLTANSSRMLKKIDKKHVYCNDGASFRWGGGLFAADPAVKITLWAVERDLHTQTTINCF